MTTIDDFFNVGDRDDTPALCDCRLGPDPSYLLLFTNEIEAADFHYVEDESLRGYVMCPGEDCPVCWLGDQAKRLALLPVFKIDDAEVQVLRIPQRRGPHTLADTLVCHLSNPDLASMFFSVTRDGGKYRVTAESLAENADRGEAQIKAFIALHEQGLKLASAFAQMSPKDLSELDRYHRKLTTKNFDFSKLDPS